MHNVKKIGYLAIYEGSKVLGKILDYAVSDNEIYRGAKWGTIPGFLFGMAVSPFLAGIDNDFSTADIVYHSTVAGAAMGFFSKRHGMMKGALMASAVVIALWEGYEFAFHIGRGSVVKDILSDITGIAAYPIGSKIFSHSIPILKQKVLSIQEKYEQKLDLNQGILK